MKIIPSLALSFLLFTFPPASRAQETPAALVERQKVEAKEEVTRLLKSGTPRDRAWAAHLCVKHGLKECVPALIAALNPKFGDTGWASPTHLCPDVGRTEVEVSRIPEAQIQALGNQAVLDALIRLGARPSAKDLQPFFKGHPNEAIILLSRNPKQKGHEAALVGFLTPEYRNFVVHVLTASRSEMLAIHILKDPMVLQVELGDPEPEKSSSVRSGTPGASITTSAPCKPSGFPPVQFYKLVLPPLAYVETRNSASEGHEGHLAWKILTWGEFHEMSWKEYSDTEIPYHLPCLLHVASLLGNPQPFLDLPVFPKVTLQLPWAGQKDACQHIADTCARTRKAFFALKQRYVAKNILTQSEADAIPLKIKLEILDARPSGSRPLPKIECPDCL